jgi:death-on-curing protein
VTAPTWLEVTTIIALHDRLIADFGGLPGVRDQGLLESALARPQNLLAYGTPPLFEMAAAYGYGLARNRAFLDGNKRIALVAIDVFLQLNGYELTATEADAVFTIRDLASGQLDETQLAEWVTKHTERTS